MITDDTAAASPTLRIALRGIFDSGVREPGEVTRILLARPDFFEEILLPYVELMLTRYRAEADEYYRLCDEARALGIPVSLDDPRSPNSVDALRLAVASAR